MLNETIFYIYGDVIPISIVVIKFHNWKSFANKDDTMGLRTPVIDKYTVDKTEIESMRR